MKPSEIILTICQEYGAEFVGFMCVVYLLCLVLIFAPPDYNKPERSLLDILEGRDDESV